jgi:hypothetical protein
MIADDRMAPPLNKIKKIRSLDEILTRGGQALSAYRDQRSGGKVPTDDEFFGQVDASQFGQAPVIAETIWQKFFANGKEHFFPPFAEPVRSAAAFAAIFGSETTDQYIAAADKIVGGRIDLLGLKNLYVGTEIDWHREPISAKRSPLKHWKQFDDLDTAETGNKKVIWELNRHQHFFTLGVAFWLTRDEHYGQAFARQLRSWMDDNPPGIGINWTSSLEVSFRAMSWIWAFHFFKGSDHFTPELFKDAVKFLYLHGRHIERYLSKYYSPNTHLTGEALGLYYLGTQLPFLRRAKQWRDLGEEILTGEVTRQLLPDGVYFEQSTWYQRYTVDMFSQFAVLRALNGDGAATAGSSEFEDRLQKAFDVLMYLTPPDGRTPLIGDDDGGRLLPLTFNAPDDFRGSLALSSIMFDRGDHKYATAGPSGEIFWLTGVEGISSFIALKEHEPWAASIELADGGYCVMRDGWEDTDNYLLVDCGEVGSLSGAHGHADALSIEVAIHGRSMLVDSGSYTYHESRELRDHFRSSLAHNTLVIDGLSSSTPGTTFGWKTRANAERKQWITDDRFDFFEGSHDGYQRLSAPATHTRSIMFLKGDYWIMRDVVETSGSHDYSLNFHFDDTATPAVSSDGKYVGDDGYRLFTFGDNGAWQQKESWISKVHGNKINAPFLRFMSSGDGVQEFFTFILPVDSQMSQPEVVEASTPAGRAFVIKYGPYRDLLIFNDTEQEYIDAGGFESNCRYTWARLREGESIPDEFVLINGDGLRISGINVVDVIDHKYAAARRLGSELYIRSGAKRSRSFLPKHLIR